MSLSTTSLVTAGFVALAVAMEKLYPQLATCAENAVYFSFAEFVQFRRANYTVDRIPEVR